MIEFTIGVMFGLVIGIVWILWQIDCIFKRWPTRSVRPEKPTTPPNVPPPYQPKRVPPRGSEGLGRPWGRSGT